MELKSTINQTWKICTYWSLLGFLIFVIFLNQKSNFSLLLVEFHPISKTVIDPKKSNNVAQIQENHQIATTTIEETSRKTKKIGCNMYEGRWVYHPEEVPSYDGSGCPFLENFVRCRHNGRPDSDYEKWRWHPRDCDIPLFNGRDMLERLRNKRLIIVGDSLNKNQFESLACLLYSSISPSRTEVQSEGSIYRFLKAKDYNCTVEFYWSPFLVELNKGHESGQKVLVLDKISELSEQWRGADVMVFNSASWWNHPDQIKAWEMLQYKGKLIKEMPREVAYKRGMKTWIKWLKNNVDPRKTKVFFRSFSEKHHGMYWCYNSTQPLMFDDDDNESFPSELPKPLLEVIEGLIVGMKSKVQVNYLNITKLSQYRRDAHPSLYTSLERKNDETFSIRKSDCSHWCLPGLPDTWNRLLYASLFFDGFGDLFSS